MRHISLIRPEVSATKRMQILQLRLHMTLQEQLLWNRIRNKQLGFHFRKQQAANGFVVDFYCHRARLVIEIDGAIHESQQAPDAHRTSVLNRRGCRVVRFTNEDVQGDLDTVVEQIRRICVARCALVAADRRNRGHFFARVEEQALFETDGRTCRRLPEDR